MIFSVGDWVFLRVSPMKGVMRFGRRGKLSPRYIGPFEILWIVGEVVYEFGHLVIRFVIVRVLVFLDLMILERLFFNQKFKKITLESIFDYSISSRRVILG